MPGRIITDEKNCLTTAMNKEVLVPIQLAQGAQALDRSVKNMLEKNKVRPVAVQG